MHKVQTLAFLEVYAILAFFPGIFRQLRALASSPTLINSGRHGEDGSAIAYSGYKNHALISESFTD
jgi:hypothetical protein